MSLLTTITALPENFNFEKIATLILGVFMLSYKPFREFFTKSITWPFESFIIALEKTIELHFGKKLGPTYDHLFFLYKFTMCTAIGAFLDICFFKPWLGQQTFLLFTGISFIRYLYARIWKKNYAREVFVANLFYGFITTILLLTIMTNATFFAVVLFFLLILLCYCDGSNAKALELAGYKHAFEHAVTNINKLDPITRSSLKNLHWAASVFPLFTSNYFNILFNGFVSSVFFKFVVYLSFKERNVYISEGQSSFFDYILKMTDTALLFSSLYLLLLSPVALLAVQNLQWRFWRKERTLVYLLIELVGYNAVCALIGNTPGKPSFELFQNQAFRLFLYGAAGGAAGVLYATAELAVQKKYSYDLTDAVAYRVANEYALSPTGTITDERMREIRSEARQEIQQPSLKRALASAIGYGQDWEQQQRQENMKNCWQSPKK